MLSTSVFGSWSFSSTGSATSVPARTPNASGSATGGFGSRTNEACSSLGCVCGSVRSSSSQSWLEGTSAPPGTVHTQPDRVSLRITVEPFEVNTGRRSSPSVFPRSQPACTWPANSIGRAGVPYSRDPPPISRETAEPSAGRRSSPTSSARYTASPVVLDRDTTAVPVMSRSTGWSAPRRHIRPSSPRSTRNHVSPAEVISRLSPFGASSTGSRPATSESGMR